MSNIDKYIINKNASIKEALINLEKLSDDVLTLFIVSDKRLIGTLTDGDIRRALIRDISIDTSVEQIMNVNFKFIYPKEKDIQKIRKIRNSGVQLLPCLNEQHELLSIYNLKEKKTILPIDAILMAGGKGERLRPLTKNTPKPLLKIGDKTIIDYNIENLIGYGVNDIYVTVNYLAEQLEAHFKEERDGLKIECVHETVYYGTIASAKLIPCLKHDDVLIMNSDLFTNIDFEDFYNFFIKNGADMLVAAVPYSVDVPYGVFELNGQHIIGVKEKPSFNYYANAGIYLIRRELLDLIPDRTFFDATDFMDLLMEKGKNVIRYPLVGYWIDIGKPDDFKKAQDFVKHVK